MRQPPEWMPELGRPCSGSAAAVGWGPPWDRPRAGTPRSGTNYPPCNKNTWHVLFLYIGICRWKCQNPSFFIQVQILNKMHFNFNFFPQITHTFLTSLTM